MTVNPLPPQAYTKETLQKAYSWLLNQSPSVKDLATTQDMLISLYLKAQRSGEASLDTPSIQNFKQELKNLASMMGDLHTPQAQTQPQPPMQTHTQAPAQNSNDQTLFKVVNQLEIISNNTNKGLRLVGNVFTDVTFLKDFVFHSSFAAGVDIRASRMR